MEKNKFVVDLGDLILTNEQRKKINAAIQKAVARELADIGTANQVALFPVNDLSAKDRRTLFGDGDVIINGIIVRDFKTADFKNILDAKSKAVKGK